MTDWLNLFKIISNKIQQETKPLIGSQKAREEMGKGAGGDISKYVDILAENIAIQTLEEKKVHCTFISEECGIRQIDEGGKDCIILDGIDGTTNITRNIPFVSTSIAHSTGWRLSDVDIALVKDLYRNINYSAVKGKGSFEKEKSIHTSNIDRLTNAILATNLTPRERLPKQISRISPILFKAHKFRQLGSTALEVCLVASGALDAFIDIDGITRATDLAAANLILKESGGLTVTSTHEELDMPLQGNAQLLFVSAANKTLIDEILGNL